MKNKTTTALLAFFLGGIGVHRFYLGQTLKGILYLVFSWTFIPSIIAFIDFIAFLIMDEEKFNNRYNEGYEVTGTTKEYIQQVQEEKTLQKGFSFVLNPNNHLELSLSEVSPTLFQEVKTIIESDEHYARQKVDLLVPIFAEHNIKCPEIEDYINKYSVQYDDHFNRLLDESEEYKTATGMDAEDIENEISEQALSLLDERADADLEILFSSRIKNLEELDDELIKEYGFDVMSKYIGLKKDEIISNWERKEFQDLIDNGLVYYGNEISKEELLPTLTLKVLNEIAEKEEGFFKRKNKAVEYIVENPQLLENVGNYVSLRKLFKKKPLPSKFDSINLGDVSTSWIYVREYVTLLVDTYESSVRYTESVKDDRSIGTSSWQVDKQEDFNSNFVCQRARKECKKKHTSPKAPFHVGCNCDITANY